MKFPLLALTLAWVGTLANVDVLEFMPFGTDNGDIDLAKTAHIGNLDDGSSIEQKLTEPFQFFKQVHHSLWVNINGAVSFNKPIDKYTPTCAALSDDEAMISPFWADVDLRVRGQVFFRQTRDAAVLTKAHEDILKAFPDIGTTDAMKWAMVVSWVNVPFYDDQACSSWSNLTNTFQLTLTTDGKYSFVIFYYNKIEWTTGTASGSDGCSGHGGKPARAGFDNGKGIMTVIDESCKDTIQGVPTRTIGMTPGKYVFRVDDNEIISPNHHTLGTIVNSPVTEPSNVTTTPHPITEGKDFETHLTTTKKKLNDLIGIATSLCPGLIDHPALQDECFDDWKRLDNLLDELLKFTKTDDELARIDYEAEKIARDLRQIMEDIA